MNTYNIHVIASCITVFLSLSITFSNELLHIEFCLCVISMFRIFYTNSDILNFRAILVQNMKFF